jgi:DNA-binding IclR family transcriptional regulator
VLRAFSPRDPVLPLAAVAARADLDKATARRLLLTLREAGLVQQDALTRHYSLSLGLLELGAAVPDSRDLREQARVVLSELATRTGTTAYLGVPREGTALCLERVDGNHPVQIRAWSVGSRLPFNCGAGPRVLLAHRPPAEIEVVLQRGLRALTARSQVDPVALRRELARIRRRGWALAIDDVTVGLAAIGAPVKNGGGDVIAAISLAGLTQHLLVRRHPRFLKPLLLAARELTARL